MNHGIKLADGTFIAGTCGKTGVYLLMKIKTEDAFAHYSDFMNPEKTKVITYIMNSNVYVHEGFTTMSYMQPDEQEGIMKVFMKKP